MTAKQRSTAAPTAAKKPKQLRSRQIVRAIIEACRKIMLEEGAESLNTNYIAEVAGVNIASLYRWFPNKDVIIAEAFEEQVAEEIKDLPRIFETYTSQPDITLEALVCALIIDPLISRQIRFLSLHACFYQEHQPDFDVGKRRWEGRDNSLIEEAGQWLASTLPQYHPTLTASDCELRAYMATRSIESLCLTAASDRPEWLRDPVFRQELLKLVMPYLNS